MKVKTDLMKKIEDLAHQCKPQEMGGYLIKNSKGVVADFIPVPNTHPEPRTHFQPPGNAGLYLASQYARVRGRSCYSYSVEAFFHSHPDPCIMSAADVSYAEYNKGLLFVTLSPVPSDRFFEHNYIWYACRGIVPEKVEFV